MVHLVNCASSLILFADLCLKNTCKLHVAETLTEEKRPIGKIVIHDTRGYAYIPKIVRREIGLEGKGKIPYYLDANVVLLVRENATKDDIVKGLDILKEDLQLRWKTDNHETTE